MKKYLSSIILIIVFAAAAWAIIYEQNRIAKIGTASDVMVLGE